jgi:A/G-specific adenine glycosylase
MTHVRNRGKQRRGRAFPGGKTNKPDPRTVAAVRRKLLAWGRDNYRQFPWRQVGAAPYQVAIAEVLLKRTTATAAARLYPDFIARFPDWHSLVRASEASLVKRLTPIGLSRQRARDLKRLAAAVTVRRSRDLPKTLPALLELPGLGPYSARAVLSIAHGRRAAIVDSNVTRVLGRLFWPQAASLQPERLQGLADRLVAPRAHRRFNLAMLDLAASVCRYDRPRCENCPLAAECGYYGRSPREFRSEQDHGIREGAYR